MSFQEGFIPLFKQIFFITSSSVVALRLANPLCPKNIQFALICRDIKWKSVLSPSRTWKNYN